MKRKFKVIICLIITIFVGVIHTYAAVTDVNSANKMISLIDNQNFSNTTSKSDVKNYINHFTYNSKYAALYGRQFDHPNSGKKVSTVSDGTYTVSNINAKGCYAHSKFVSMVIYGKNGSRKYHTEKAKSLTGQGLKSFLLNEAQAGEHLRIDNKHSVVFVSGDNNGFYYFSYNGDDYGKKILLVYKTYADFAKKYNNVSSAEKSSIWLYNANTNTNNSIVATPKPVATPTPTPKPVATPTPKPSCNHSYNKSGYCSKCNKEYSISLSSMNATYEAVKSDVPVRYRPYSPNKIIKYLSKGAKVTVVASGRNSVGNLWYKLNDGTWVYSGNLKKSSSGSTPASTQKPVAQSTSIKFELESVPKGNLPYGKSFSLKGWFRSDCAIVEARAYMLDENKNVVMQSDKASSTTSNYKIQGYKLDKAMKFNKLSPGGYYLKYFVRDANGDTATWISDKFYIVK